MCLIFAAIEQYPDYPLIIAANRDEFYQRTADAVHHWPDNNIYAGKDLFKGGTWLGVNQKGRFAAITNYREIDAPSGLLSRGEIPLQWLNNQHSAGSFHQSLAKDADQYAGYNCLYGCTVADKIHLHYVSNRLHTDSTPLGNGLFGLSNGVLDSPWFKVTEGKAAIRKLLQQPFCAEAWFAMLADQNTAPDNALPDTGLDHARELALSSRFIHLPQYGTRCSTLVLINRQQHMQIIERSYSPESEQASRNGTTRSLSFPIHG